jgi:LysM repeat protein
MVHNIRYSVVDEKTVVLGIPESTGEGEATRKGYTIPSEGLAALLKNYFIDCDNKTGLKEYLQEVIKQTGATIEHVAREFKVDEKDLKELAHQEKSNARNI